MAATSVEVLTEATKQIQKAIESGDPASTLLNLMKPLESFKVNESTLRHSKIGVAVAKLRQNKDKEVQEKAGKLVNKWKNDVHRAKATASRGTSGSPAPAATVKKESDGKNASIAATETKKDGTSELSKTSPEKERPKVDLDKRNTHVDGVNFRLTGEPARDGTVKLMYDGLAFMSSESSSSILSVARSIEAAAFAHFHHTTSADYKAQIRSLFQNLKIRGNKSLRQDVYSGSISPSEFVTMTSEDLKSAEKKAEDRALEKENMKAAMTAKEEKAISTTMQCGKCKKFKVAEFMKAFDL